MRTLNRMLPSAWICAALLALAGHATAGGPAPGAGLQPAVGPRPPAPASPVRQAAAAGRPDQTAHAPAPAAEPADAQVTVEQLRLALISFLDKRYKDKVAEIEVTVLSPDEAVTVPGGRLELRIRPRGLHEGFGRRLFEVAFLVDRKEVRRLPVMAEVTLQADVLTATRNIRPEETLEAEDIKIARVALPGGGHDYLTDFEEAVGKRVLRPLRADGPIRSSSLAFPEVIQKGDQVTIEVKHGGLLIQANGTSKTGGSMGQSITVLNQDSKKEVRARIVGPGTVRVEF